MHRRTTMSTPETSEDGSVVGAVVGTCDAYHWQKILASFIAKSSAALAHPYFYLIRTNTRWSLCILSGLSPTNYSALLLECELVSIRTATATTTATATATATSTATATATQQNFSHSCHRYLTVTASVEEMAIVMAAATAATTASLFPSSPF
jgi:hypothetical protein